MMQNYKKFLVALELNYGAETFVIDKVKTLAKEAAADIYLIHAVENVGNYGASYAVSAGVDIEHILFEDAKEKLGKVGEILNVESDKLIVEKGIASKVILDFAEEIKSDLIIVGSHGKHGLTLLLGSTANSVIHGAKCDVLAVRSP